MFILHQQKYLEQCHHLLTTCFGRLCMFEKFHQGKISIEKIIEKMAHNPAKLFKIEKAKMTIPAGK